MKRSFSILFLFSSLFAYTNCFAQQYWMEQGGGVTIDEGADISIDASGNTYATGYFTGTATFGTFSVSSSGVTDIYLAKLDAAGVYQWVVKAGGSFIDRPFSIKTDAAGNSYITGFYYGSATFGSFNIISSGLQDVFIAKYDNTGTCLWVQSAGGSLSDIGNGITVDNAGNVIVTGEFSGSASFGSTTLSSMNNSVDVFTTKLDGNGNFLWAKQGAAPQTDRGIDVGADASGNIYVTGQFTDTITFDVPHYSNMYNAIFLIKYNSAGAEQWFRIIAGASQNIANAIAIDSNGNPVIAGDFQGTLTFFAAPTNSTLAGAYFNKIFVAQYDANGNKMWSSESSSGNDVIANNLALDASNNPFVIGNFKCKFNDYADLYGQGVFNSVGYWDVFVAKWNSSGVWQWARQVGGHADEYGTGITVNAAGEPIFTGSFTNDIIIPTRNTFLGYDAVPTLRCTNPYCSDNFYGVYTSFTTRGNSDIIISKTIDPLRQPYDFYQRTGSGCNREQIGVCIDTTGALSCPDTVEFCQSGSLSTNSYTCNIIGPNYTYLWSNGSTGSGTSANSTGWYSVTQTSADGCFVSMDSIYVIIHPLPPVPTISDDVIVNTNSTNPSPIELCQPATIVLTGGNYGSNSYTWNPGGPDTSITVNTTGNYCFTVTDTFGCRRSTCITVELYTQLPPFDPRLICLSDPDLNDTVTLCQGDCYQMMVYDTITNPTAIIACLPAGYPYNTITTWSSTPPISSSPSCNAIQYFCPGVTGWDTIHLMLVRLNICDTDTFFLSKPIYAIVNPVPVVSESVTGSPWLCPTGGDSVMLVASGTCPNATWTGPGVTGSTSDTVWANQPGSYSIGCTVTNTFGCSATASAGVSVQVKPQPQISIIPSGGVICPNDSVQLLCIGTGTFQWQGPGGPTGGNTNTIYVNQPGIYYCILTDTDFCALVSNTVLVLQYSTPYLTPPTDTICQGDSVVISVVAGGGSTILWQPPLSGNSPTQTVTAAGTYTCHIISCGITTIASVTVYVAVPLSQITASGDSIFCAGDSVILSANANMASYVWNPGAVIGQYLTVYQTGSYTLTTTNSFGCSATSAISLFSYTGNAVVPVATDTTVCKGHVVTLHASGSNIVWYSSPSSGNILFHGNSYTPPPLTANTVYYIASTDSVCKSTFVPLNVKVENCEDSIPNVFTPNGDGLNDSFIFPPLYTKCFHVKIYNRWGNLIYEGSDPLKGWDGRVTPSGKPASDGVYYYILKYCDPDLTEHATHGYIELIRG